MAKESTSQTLKIVLSESRLLQYGGRSRDSAVVMMGDKATKPAKD